MGLVRSDAFQRFARQHPSLRRERGSVFEQAVRAGAKVTMPLDDMFWGDRYGKVEDPFGHQWSIGTHIKDATEEEIQQAMEQMGS